jgi:hypothetical protein
MKRFAIFGLFAALGLGALAAFPAVADAQYYRDGYSHQRSEGHGHGYGYGYSGRVPVYHPPSVHYDKVYHPTTSHWTPLRGWHTHGHYDLVPHYTPGHYDYVPARNGRYQGRRW